ncbi:MULTISPECIES: acireductone dioxygenase [unclassified Sphingomonas]|uniref:1,2-dihydroxy-3-keto-5-methylthiopentene dioxygenase n=1 Tax=unclassified Sphingomonas TaxID=196159 RepID=UPI000BCE984A|nr:MAG: cupin [Sphingomonas sp. 12-62-6]OYX38460.1 MAG: cupin [Sphingomonas sp. 32-62-10]OYY63583.1 MAG: cupin [Sphingomonas sp. 28-62-11]
MSRLQIFGDSDANALLLETSDADVIAHELAGIGVRFERWPTRPVASADEVLTVYAPEIEKLVAADGYQSIDVMGVTPDHPDRATIRTKFLSEHTHAEDEIRFFVEGEGLFTLHEQGRVFNMLCTQGDLISVPAGMRHWFDMGAAPKFTVIRLFLNPDGWIAQFTGDDIADRFPRLERADA